MLMNLRLQNAEKGYHLSQRKTDALKLRFGMIVDQLVKIKIQLSQNWLDWQISLAEAKFTSGPMEQIVLENVSEAQLKIFSKLDNVAGVYLPAFSLYKVSVDPNKHIGLVKIFEHLLFQNSSL